MTATYTFDVFTSLDGFGSVSGGDWGGYWGQAGPGTARPSPRPVRGGSANGAWAPTHIGNSRQMLADSTDESDVRDPWVTRMRHLPATVVSTTLDGPLDWPDATVASGDAVDVVRPAQARSPRCRCVHTAACR